MDWKKFAACGCVGVADRVYAAVRASPLAAAAVVFASCLGGYAAAVAMLPARASESAHAPLRTAWVNEHEINQQERLGRHLLLLSPTDLLSIYERKGSAAIEAYRSKWVKIDYPITALAEQSSGGIPYEVIRAIVHFQSAFPGQIVAYFNNWRPQPTALRSNAHVAAFCQFRDIQPERVLTDINRLWLVVTNCEPATSMQTTATRLRVFSTFDAVASAGAPDPSVSLPAIRPDSLAPAAHRMTVKHPQRPAAPKSLASLLAPLRLRLRSFSADLAAAESKLPKLSLR